MAAHFAFLASGLLALVAVAGVVAGDDDRITICHFPPGNPEDAKTKEVSRSAWSAHEGHGDHKGRCTDADRKAGGTGGAGSSGGKTPSPPPPPPTRLSLASEGEGGVDGDAWFKVEVSNDGSATGKGVRIDGNLRGYGEWTIRAASTTKCSIENHWLSCTFADIPVGQKATVRLAFDGHLAVCDKVGFDLTLHSSNDKTTGDNRSESFVHAGACSPLDPDSA